MEDTESRHELEQSRTSKIDQPGSKMKSQKTETAVPDSRRENNTINHLNKVISKERSKVR